MFPLFRERYNCCVYIYRIERRVFLFFFAVLKKKTGNRIQPNFEIQFRRWMYDLIIQFYPAESINKNLCFIFRPRSSPFIYTNKWRYILSLSRSRGRARSRYWLQFTVIGNYSRHAVAAAEALSARERRRSERSPIRDKRGTRYILALRGT